MEKQLVILGICLLFITLNFSGCEEIGIPEVKPDYVLVTCRIYIESKIYDANDKLLQEKPEGLLVYITVVKDQGERFNFQKSLDKYGMTTLTECNFKLYKEQGIEMFVTVQGSYKNYSLINQYQKRTLSWDQVQPYASDGYLWSETFIVKLKKFT